MKSKTENNQKEKTVPGRLEPKRDRDLIARAIIVRDGAILLNRSRNAKTNEEYFALPGGHIDEGEDCVSALEREFAEELDAKIAVYDLVFVSESIYAGRRKSETQRHELVLYFHADLASELKENGKEVLSPEKDKNFQWLQLEAVPTSNILPRSLKEYLLATMLDRETAHYTFSDSTRAQPSDAQPSDAK
jgi:ADP-ribose pyrophosphatase YjhB (NUDIX family)